MKLSQQNDFPALAFHRRLERGESTVACEFPHKPSLPHPSAQAERNRCADAVAEHDNDKSPPQTEEKTAADTHNTAGQKQNITKREKQWVTKPACWPHLDHVSLRRRNKIDNREKTRQPNE